MPTRLIAHADASLISWLANASKLEALEPELRELFVQAEAHGVAGVLYDELRAAGIFIPSDLADVLMRREAARDLDHAAHLAMLHRIDLALQAAGIDAVVLKGAFLAERLYTRPSSRPSGDIDLLVNERDVDAVVCVLESLGYISSSGAREERFRIEHHHLHLFHPHALPLELHFHAYRGFGQTFRSEPLIAGRRPSPIPDIKTLGVLNNVDELVYLAVHAAAHRFIRLGWLYDLKLLVSRMTDDEIVWAGTRAKELKYARVVAFTAGLLIDLLGVDASVVRSLGQLGHTRETLLRSVVREPTGSVIRSATRFVYSAALCDDASALRHYASAASYGYVRRLARLED